MTNVKEISEEIRTIEIEREENRYSLSRAKLLIIEVEELLATMEARLSREVFFDAELKNDGQRKAVLQQKMNLDDHYHDAKKRMRDLQRDCIEFEHRIKMLTIRSEAKKRMFDILIAEGKN